ncbi:hypothetical protein DERF_014350 [Dermatophagoides farinae]|uniref:Uncharacterized protein n=1 Tax=Dermatophagoides farinae TaxID=6954 RepID=A0A922HHM7_DERFA|nr:hypothetical protein DERF_014350 [Dermatophagoides farinae]
MDIFCEEFILPIPLLIGQQLSQIQMLDENHRKNGMNVFAASLTGVKETEIHFKRYPQPPLSSSKQCSNFGRKLEKKLLKINNFSTCLIV